MKVTQVSENIWACRIWAVFLIQVWLVKEKDGITLVDTGLGMMAKGVMNAIKQLNAGPLERIVLTHGHPDHIGGLKKMRRISAVPTYAHRIEIPYMQGELPYRDGKKAVINVAKGLVKALDEDDSGRLLPVGSLIPYLTPGHSPGHVVFYHEKDGVLLAGDLFSSRKGQLRAAPFTPDLVASVQSSAIVSILQPKRVEVCHGHSVLNPAEQIEQYKAKYI